MKKMLIALAMITAIFYSVSIMAQETTIRVALRVPDDSPDRVFYRQVMDEFERDNPGIKIELIPHISNDQLLVHIAAGIGPDIANIGSGTLYGLVAHDAALPLDDFMQSTSWGKELQNKMTPTALSESHIMGHQYGIPLAAGANIPIYNADLFSERGLSFPEDDWTWDDAFDISRKLTVADELFGFGNMRDNANWYALFFSHGGTFYDSTQTQFVFESPGGHKAFKMIMDFVEYETALPMQDNSRSAFANGKVGVTFASTGWPAILDQAEVPFEWRFADPPIGDVRRSVPGGNHPLVILKSSKHDPQLNWRVIEAFTSDEAQLGIANLGLRLPTNLSVLSRIEDPIMYAFARNLVYQTPYAGKKYEDTSTIMTEYVVQMLRGSIAPEMAVEEIQRLGSAALRE